MPRQYSEVVWKIIWIFCIIIKIIKIVTNEFSNCFKGEQKSKMVPFFFPHYSFIQFIIERNLLEETLIQGLFLLSLNFLPSLGGVSLESGLYILCQWKWSLILKVFTLFQLNPISISRCWTTFEYYISISLLDKIQVHST